MKNLKKVLALAVAFVMCFTMFAGAAVFSDVPAGGDYSEAITFLSDIQVIAGKPDGSFGVNDAITRADAACLIARMMTGQMNPPKYDNHVAFSDVEVGSYYESSVGYCAALGITSGTGNGMFSPKRTITDGEFVAMLTRALGYDTPENPLSYPMGNIVTAQAKGLLDGVNVDYMSDALRGEDAQMMYNAIFADYDRAAKNKNVYQAADDHYNVTIAEEVFHLGRLAHRDVVSTTTSGAVISTVGFHGYSSERSPVRSCDAHTWVIAGVDARAHKDTYVAYAVGDNTDKAIQPRDEGWAYQEFTYSGDIKPLLGYRVELWGPIDHSQPIWDVEAIKVLDGQSAYDYNAGMYTDTDQVVVGDKTLKIQKNNNQVNMASINLDLDTTAKLNWATEDNSAINPVFGDTTKGLDAIKYGYAYTLANVDARLNRCTVGNIHLNFADGDQYKLFDWDGDDYIDFVVRETYKYGEVTAISKSRVVLSVEDRRDNASGTPVEGEFALKLGEDDLVVQGADGLEEGDIVEISVVSRVNGENKYNDEIVTINLSKVDPESLTLEKINLTKDTYTFDGEERTFADRDLFDLVEEDDSAEEMRTKENVGQAFNIWFDKNGFMLKGRVADDKARGYLMILSTADGNSKLYNTTVVKGERRDLAVMDVLFDDNSVAEEVEVVKDLKIDNKSDGSNGYDKSDRSWDQKMVIGNVYKYYMNEDNQITRLEKQTTNQASNYSYDDSKDRISIINDENGKYTNYSFAKDGVIFAALVTEPTEARAQGYVRRAANGDFYVDPDDVVAVKPDDVPEIDNRENATNTDWRTTQDVTHPAILLQNWMLTFTIGTDDPISDAPWIRNDVARTILVNGGATVGFAGAPDVPAIAYKMKGTSNEIAAAVIGVDNLDYFNQREVKLALITDVNYLGKDTYSIEGAIDGKIAEFKTIAADEGDMFTGRNGTISSFADMESYLNQNRSSSVDAGYEGARHGLYAEVTMNSDGLITKVRAMNVVKNGTWTDGTNPSKTIVMEGNVYRVVRGVVTQNGTSSNKDLITWQTNPIAASGSRFYPLREYDDHNLFDTLEADKTADTFFYEVTELPLMKAEEVLTVDTPFDANLSDHLKPADSGIIEESLFINVDPGSAVYYIADFAVRKADTDKLVAVFAFSDDLSNGNAADTKDSLDTAAINKSLKSVSPYSDGVLAPVAQQLEVEVAVASDDAVEDEMPVSGTIDGEAFAITFSPDKAARKEVLEALAKALKDEGGLLDDEDPYDYTLGTLTLKVKSTTESASKLTLDLAPLQKIGLTFTVKEVVAPKDKVTGAARSSATSTITIPAGIYEFDDSVTYQIKSVGTNSSFTAGVNVVIVAGRYSAGDIASMIAEALTDEDALPRVTASASANIVTVTDRQMNDTDDAKLGLTMSKVVD